MRNIIVSLTFLLFTVLLSAGNLYINGVKIDGELKGQTIKNCTIEFKANGDCYITAPNYEITQKNTTVPGKSPAVAKNAKHYYAIFTIVSGNLTVPVTLFLNGKQLKQEVVSTGQLSVDLGALTPGQYQINALADSNATVGQCSLAVGIGVERKNALEISVITEKKGEFGAKGLSIAHIFTVE